MSNKLSNKFLEATFSLLVLIIIGELVYLLFYHSKGSPPSSYSQLNVNRTQKNNNLIKDSIDSNSIVINLPNDALLSKSNLLALANLTKRANLFLRVEFSGIIGGLEDAGDNERLIVKIVDEQGNKIVNYIWSKQKADDLNIYRMEGDKKIPITINDLKINDKILVIDEHDFKDNKISLNVFITK
ncbi:MAG: hypothetical protein NC935_08435 [Candidatus Omnitrophica bacterium]|nr:hypothetical protein [Candidatus Omnitrophota bacterium]